MQVGSGGRRSNVKGPQTPARAERGLGLRLGRRQQPWQKREQLLLEPSAAVTFWEAGATHAAAGPKAL